jgi:D-2-hydroxyacid dehydrogenase (NADP+)
MGDEIRVVVGPSGSAHIAEAIDALPGVTAVVGGSRGEVPALLDGADVLITFRWSDDWLVPGLRWIQAVSSGTDQFPVDRLGDAGVVLTSARGIHETQVAEHALALLLAMTRGVAGAVRNQAERRWQVEEVHDLAGMTLGILGLGVIGEGLARRARALHMRVIGTKKRPDGYAGAAETVFPPERTREVFDLADAVIVTLPGTDDTAGLVGPAELSALAGGWLVNVGRAGVVDTASLVEALEAGTLRGAALDVFDEEPLPSSSPLWDVPNLIVSPHLAGLSPRYGERLAEVFAANLDAYRGTAEWVNRVV